MRTFQNLSALRENGKNVNKFVFDVIAEHKDSAAYKVASIAEKYYAKKNVTIMAFQKMLYNMQGQQVPDMWSANYKLRTHFFRRFVIQQTQYVLANGVIFQKKVKFIFGLFIASKEKQRRLLSQVGTTLLFHVRF